MLSPLLTAAVFSASIGIVFVNEDLAKFMWLLILPISLVGNRRPGSARD